MAGPGLLDRLLGFGRRPVRQAGAIPYAVRDGAVVVLLITSRRTGRWIFPKGGLVDGLDEPAAAAREAWEEAGVRGRVGRTCLGLRRAYKIRGRTAVPLEIAMYPLRVEREADDWPERDQRRRCWLPVAEARRRVRDRALARMIDRLAEDAASR